MICREMLLLLAQAGAARGRQDLERERGGRDGRDDARAHVKQLFLFASGIQGGDRGRLGLCFAG